MPRRCVLPRQHFRTRSSGGGGADRTPDHSGSVSSETAARDLARTDNAQKAPWDQAPLEQFTKGVGEVLVAPMTSEDVVAKVKEMLGISEDWHPADIAAALTKRGHSQARLSIDRGDGVPEVLEHDGADHRGGDR